MASARVIQGRNTPEMIWYALGEKVGSGVLPREFSDDVLTNVGKNFSNLVPTTYDAAQVYLQEELKKPEGNRDLHREMAMIIVMDIPDKAKVVFKPDALKVLMPLAEGSSLFYPTVDLPPDTFGTQENPLSEKLVDAETFEPRHAMLLISYFTRVGPGRVEYVGAPTKTTKLEVSSPFT